MFVRAMSAERRKSPPPTIKLKSEFRRVFRTGRRVRDDFLQIISALSDRKTTGGEHDRGRVGYVIPEKAVKGAVRRNRIRRLLREALRKWWGHVLSGWDIVLQVGRFPNHDHAEYVEMVLLGLFMKADLLDDDGVELAKERIESLSKRFHRAERH